MLVASVVALATRRWRRVPYALGLVIAGLLVGATHLLPMVRLQPQVLFTVLLPPLLFESAIHLRAGALRGEWKPITLLAVGATILSTFVIGGLAALILRLPLAVALVFGALISATDPISVIALFRELGASRRLTLIVDAEALFNDGVAVVLFTVLLGAATGSPVSLAAGAGQFLLVGVGGTAIGALIGFAVSRLTQHIDDHLIEITLTTIAAWGAFLAAERLHVSGVLAVIAAGMVVGNYGMPATMSPTTRLAVGSFWEYAAFVVNSVVFLTVGVAETQAGLLRALPVALGAALIVLGGRLTVYPVCWVANQLGGRRVPRSFQHVLVWGGLRGALSMALALGLPLDFPYRETIVQAAFGAVLFSLLAQGLTVGPLLQRLGLARGETERAEQRERAFLAAQQISTGAALGELNRLDALEAFPEWAIEPLRAEFAARAQALAATQNDLAQIGRAESAVAEPLTPEAVSPLSAATTRKSGSPLDLSREVRRHVLAAERIALRAAVSAPVRDETTPDPELLRTLITRIDAQLLALAHESAE